MGIGTLGFHLLAQFAIGSLMLLVWVPPPRESRGFGTFAGASSLVLLLLGIAAGGMAVLRGEAGSPAVRVGLLGCLAASGLVAGGFLAGWRRLGQAGLWINLACGAIFLAGTARIGLPAIASGHTVAGLDQAQYLVSSLLLGSVYAAMVLGHWYLTAPGMSLQPLRRLSRAFLVLGITKGVLVVPSLALLATGGSFRHGTLWFGLNAFEWMLLLARIAIGVGATVGTAWMTLKTIDLRSTTSATGLLYVAMVLVAMGEIFARMFADTAGVNL